MNYNNSKLIAYAIDFTSYMIQKIKLRDKIKNIILFGSVARDEANQNSDIDIFINFVGEDSLLEKEIKEYLDDFLESSKYKSYWRLLNIKNEIKLIIGVLDKWKELKPSIIADGIILYGKFKSQITEGSHAAFFIWESVKPNSKRVLFNKQLLGYKQNEKFYRGLLQKFNGERLGKGCIFVPLEHANVFHSLFKKYKISVKIKKVLDYAL